MREPEPTIRSRELGLALSRAVEAKGMNGAEVARRMGWSHTKVSRMFSGKRGGNNIADVAGVLAICDIVGPKRDELLEIAERARERGWWQDYRDSLPPELGTLSDLENDALMITSFETSFVPGLLQTPDYMRTLLYRTPQVPAKEVPARIDQSSCTTCCVCPSDPMLSSVLFQTLSVSMQARGSFTLCSSTISIRLCS